MRTLTPTLLAAQQAASGVPYVKIEVLDMLAGVVRPTFNKLYLGSEPDSYHAAAAPGDASLVRAYTEPGTGKLFVQRVPSPGSGSNFSSWTQLDTANVSAGIALCSRGTRVMLFFVDPYDGVTLYLRESTDYGASWGARQTVMIAPVTAVTWLAAALSTADVPALFFTDDTMVYVTRRVGGSWTSAAPWGTTLAEARGVACAYVSDWHLVVAAKESSTDDAVVLGRVYGDGGGQPAQTWSAIYEVARAAAGSGVTYRAPFLAAPDVHRLTYVEQYSGADRPHWLITMPGTAFAEDQWRDPVALEYQASYGAAVAAGGGSLFLTTPSRVWTGSLSASSVDLSADVLRLEYGEGPAGGRVSVTLRNDDGRYGGIGSGAYAPVRTGSEVRFSPGYITSQGIEVSDGTACWITGWEHRAGNEGSVFVLHATDAWWLLEGWRARQQHTWSAGQANVVDILTFLLRRVGLALTVLSASGTATTHKPAFTINPGESGARAVRRLLAAVPDVLFFRGSQAYLKYPQATDASDYSLGGGHVLHEGRYRSGAYEANRAQVYGGVGMQESLAWDEAWAAGERLLQAHDRNMDTGSKEADHAALLLRRQGMQGTAAQVTLPPNCGQELYDVVEVTDARAGISARKYRVAGIEMEYQVAGRPRYLQRLGLQGV